MSEYSAADFFKLYDRKAKIRDLFERYRNSGAYSSWEDFLKKLEDAAFKSAILRFESRYIDEWQQNFQANVSKDLLTTCFSKSFDSILMWAHYADKYRGCVLGFDYDEDPDFSSILYDVNYRKKPFAIHPKYCYGHRDTKLMLKALTSKYLDWSYEEECRLIFPKQMLATIQHEGRDIFGIPGCRRHIKRIILGNRFSGVELFPKLMSLASEQNVEIGYGRLKTREYKIIVTDSA